MRRSGGWMTVSAHNALSMSINYCRETAWSSDANIEVFRDMRYWKKIVVPNGVLTSTPPWRRRVRFDSWFGITLKSASCRVICCMREHTPHLMECWFTRSTFMGSEESVNDSGLTRTGCSELSSTKRGELGGALVTVLARDSGGTYQVHILV